MKMVHVAGSPVLLALLAACGGTTSAPATMHPDDSGNLVLPSIDASPSLDGGHAAPDATAPATDAEAGAPSRFITEVISFTPGACAGFGQDEMPGIVYGPPVGAGRTEGSSDVVSLGNGGAIVVGFAPNAIVDGPGVDFIVFENPFFVDGNPKDEFAEPGEVSVSEDGVTWHTYPCTDTTQSPPYGQCAGVNPVLSSPGNGISPFDPAKAGGDAYDLATLGVKEAKYIRIRDVVIEGCTAPDGGMLPTKNGFDLDAIAIVNAALP